MVNDDKVRFPQPGWGFRLLAKAKWQYIVRTVGLAAFIYEVLVEQTDRPSLLIVIGTMIIGAEAFNRDRIKKNGNGNS